MANNSGRKLKRRNRWADILAALLLCAFLVMGAFWLNNYIRSRMLQFTTVEAGSIPITLAGEMLVVRQESLLYAEDTGQFVPLAAEGERVREGSVIGNVGLTPVYASKGGVVSYLLDGWEEALSSEAINELNLDLTFYLLAEDAQSKSATEEQVEAHLGNIASGRPVARIVDNLIDYTVILKVRDERDLLEGLTRLSFTLEEGGSYRVSIKDQGVTDAGDNYYVFSMPSSEDKLLSLRYSRLDVIAKDISGILVPSSAIFVNEEGQTGVYLQRKRKLVFQEITELTSQNGWSVVEGLSATAQVVTNPAKAQEGQRIY